MLASRKDLNLARGLGDFRTNLNFQADLTAKVVQTYWN